MEVKATAKYIRTSPRKVRLVVDAVRGKPVPQALAILSFLPQHASEEVMKVVKSAVASAENNYQMAADELYITKISAYSGPTMKRFRPRPRGRADRILKRSTNITVVVEEREAS
jgi:large subunit ribosomal protein L22